MELLILFFAAIPIGIFGIIVGGNATLSIPLFQLLFPEMTLGSIIGNIKPGSVVRNIGSLIPLRRDLSLKTISPLILPLIGGSVLAALLISSVSQAWILPILIFGWLVVEYGQRLARHISSQLQFIATWLVGMYGGTLGAGVSLLIVSLLRLQDSNEQNTYLLRSHALWLETMFTAAAVVVFIFQGLVFWDIASVWIVGSLVGGYLGGILLRLTGKLSGATQTWILRGAFLFAILIAARTFI